jgi:hypothetical protein
MKRKDIPDLSAEAYFLTVFPAEAKENGHFFLDCHGTKSRGRERDVLGESQRNTVLNKRFIEMRGLEVSRNGIYDLLPESLFHPLVLGSASANTYEIVQEIKEIRSREQENRLFFMPFDTEFFLWKSAMLEAELKTETDNQSKYEDLLRFVYGSIPGFAKKDPGLLLSFLLHGQPAIDNADLLGKFLTKILACEVSIRELRGEMSDLPFAPLGSGKLGVDTALTGSLTADWDDWQVEIAYRDANMISEAATDETFKEELVELIRHFALAPREIYLKWIALSESRSPELGVGLLGINTYTNIYA